VASDTLLTIRIESARKAHWQARARAAGLTLTDAITSHMTSAYGPPPAAADPRQTELAIGAATLRPRALVATPLEVTRRAADRLASSIRARARAKAKTKAKAAKPAKAKRKRGGK